MKNPKTSIIVPVYKAEKYLHKCVDSILAQSFTDFEVLLIDDGSPDKSGEICDEYAKKDSRVRVIHKENGGVSNARQCGIDNAQGEYTIHVDPDDWVEPTMLEVLYHKAKEEDADMVICDFFIESKDGQKYVIQKPSALDNETVLKELFQQLHGSCGNKLIRRTCYNNFEICFPSEMNLWEDGYVMFNMVMNSIKISYVPCAFYHYNIFINENSIVRKPSIRDLNSMNYLIDYLESHLPYGKYSDELYKKKCEAKVLSFRLSRDYNEFVNLYKEINCRFIAQENKGRRLNRFVAISLNTNALIYYLLRKIYFIYNAK